MYVYILKGGNDLCTAVGDVPCMGLCIAYA